MPTVGWILEDAVERFWEGQPRHVPTPIPRPEFVCKHCGKKLSSPEELRRHFNLDHPLELPSLYVRGNGLLRESVVRSPLEETDVELFQCTRCEVQMDGGYWQKMAAPEFRTRFTLPVDSTWNVRLVHERAFDKSSTQAEYCIRFRIPDPVALNMVDERFIQTLVVQELRHTELGRFEACLPKDGSACEYGRALGDYALGIILKERRSPPHAPVGFEEFAVKMRSALEVLRFFNRPVALTVSSSIRFNLNDFHDQGVATATEIETGLHFFRSIMVGTTVGDADNGAHPAPNAHSAPAVCPVDQVTHRLLSACASLNQGCKLSLGGLELLRQLTRGTIPVSEQDLAKVHVICAIGYLRIARGADALPHLKAVQFDPSLKEWAQRQLNSVSPHET
jgi:hypothetical protein